jgi:hypothetical protein
MYPFCSNVLRSRTLSSACVLVVGADGFEVVNVLLRWWYTENSSIMLRCQNRCDGAEGECWLPPALTCKGRSVIAVECQGSPSGTRVEKTWQGKQEGVNPCAFVYEGDKQLTGTKKTG